MQALDLSLPLSLVISGGSLKCVYALGLMEALSKRGVYFSNIVTTSAGAAMAAYWMSGRSHTFVELAKESAAKHRWLQRKGWRMQLTFQNNFDASLTECVDWRAVVNHPTALHFNAWELPAQERLLPTFYRAMRTTEKWMASHSDGAHPLLTSGRTSRWKEHWWCTKELGANEEWKRLIFSTCRVPPLFHPGPEHARMLDGGVVWPIPVLKAASLNSEQTLVVAYNQRNIQHAHMALNHYHADNAPAHWMWHAPKYVPVGLFAYNDYASFLESFELGLAAGDAMALKAHHPNPN